MSAEEGLATEHVHVYVFATISMHVYMYKDIISDDTGSCQLTCIPVYCVSPSSSLRLSEHSLHSSGRRSSEWTSGHSEEAGGG